MKYFSYLFVLLLAACSSNGVIKESQMPKQIIPLAIGNVWEFTDQDGKDDYIAEIQSIETIDGKEWYVYRELEDESTYYVNNSDKGQIELGLDFHDEYLVLPYPVEAEIIYDQFDVRNKVTPNVEITVPAGTFNTYKYTFGIDDPTFSTTYWIAPGVGVVKLIYTLSTFEYGATEADIYDQETFELINYSLQ